MLISLFLAASVSAMPAKHGCQAPNHQQALGEYTFKKWWLDVYHAKLYQPQGAKAAQQAAPGTQLHITYLRSIKHEALVKQTQKQWQHMDLEASLPTKQWLKQLNQLWPNVKKDDCIAFEVGKNRQGIFYLGQKRLGVITEPQFSKVFLAIWLSPQTEYPKQRQQLLGRSGS